MKNGIYCLCNILSCRFGDTMAFATDGFAQRRLEDSFTQGNLGNRDEYILKRVGEIDIATGEVIPCVPVQIPWSVTISTETQMTSV